MFSLSQLSLHTIAWTAIVSSILQCNSIYAQELYSCEVDGVSFHGYGHYFNGSVAIRDSLYANCIKGEPFCYKDDGILDRADDPIDCKSITLNKNDRDLGLMITSDRTWPERVVCYEYSAYMSSNVRGLIEKAIVEYQEKVAITWIPGSECRSTYGENTDVCGNCETIVKFKSDEPGCFATVGYLNAAYAGQPIVNLDPVNCEVYGSVVHEMGHIAGLFHEHAHPEREVVILRNEITVGAENYIKQAGDDVQHIKYDRKSVMHYGGYELCIPKDTSVKWCDINQDSRDGCVVPTEDDCDRSQQDTFGTSEDLSPGDIKSIETLYKDQKPSKYSPGGAPVEEPSTAPVTTSPPPPPTTTSPPPPTPTTTSPPPPTPTTTSSPPPPPTTTTPPSTTTESPLIITLSPPLTLIPPATTDIPGVPTGGEKGGYEVISPSGIDETTPCPTTDGISGNGWGDYGSWGNIFGGDMDSFWKKYLGYAQAYKDMSKQTEHSYTAADDSEKDHGRLRTNNHQHRWGLW